MGLTFDELVADRTKEEYLEQILLALQGLGFVKKEGFGIGDMAVAGIAAAPYSVVVRIIDPGGLGVATFEYSLDGGDTFEDPEDVPVGGNFTLEDTGAILIFSAGDTALSGNSFEAGDTYTFEMWTPTFQATAWQEGSTALTLAETDADITADLSTLVSNIAKGGLLDTAEDDWLDLLLESVYQLSRVGAVSTQGVCVLRDMAGAGPFNITPGQLWVGTSLGLRYTNITGGTLALGAGRGEPGDPDALELTFQAEKPGNTYNVGQDSIVIMFTTLPGVTVNNPDSDWITRQGRDRETNIEARARAKLKWPSLSIGAVAESYDLWAKTASENVTRTKVEASEDDPGTVNIYLAGQGGAVDGATITAVEEYIAPRVPLCSTPLVDTVDVNDITIEGTVYIYAGYEAVAAAAIAQNIAAYLGGGTNSAGEELLGVAIGGTVYRSELIEQIQIAPGVRNIDLGTFIPAADVTLATLEVATATISLTPESV